MKINRHIPHLALALLTVCLPACSSENSGDPDAPEAIGFFATTDDAADARSFSPANMPSTLSVRAYNRTKKYFECNIARSGSEWTTDRQYFWPATGVDFYAFSLPEGASLIEGTRIRNNETWTTVSQVARFVVSTTAHEDALWGTALDRTFKDNPVRLHMHHMLSRILFRAQVMDDNTDVDISKITVRNARNQGVYNLVPDVSTDRSDALGSWDVAGSRANFSNGMSNIVINGASDARQVMNAEGSAPYELLLLPQQTDDVVLEVAYKLYNRSTAKYEVGSAAPGDFEARTVEIPLRTWLQNYSYTYTLQFKASDEVKVEILTQPFAVNPFVAGGEITPPDKQ